MFDPAPVLLASSLLTYGLAARWYAWPALRKIPIREAMTILLLPHTMRFIGLLFVTEGAVLRPLPTEFALSAAFGDVAAAVLALAALAAVRSGIRGAYSLAGIAHGFGLLDLTIAVTLGAIQGAGPSMGAAVWIPTLLVPALLVTHVMAIGLLRRCHAEKWSAEPSGAEGAVAAA